MVNGWTFCFLEFCLGPPGRAAMTPSFKAHLLVCNTRVRQWPDRCLRLNLVWYVNHLTSASVQSTRRSPSDFFPFPEHPFSCSTLCVASSIISLLIPPARTSHSCILCVCASLVDNVRVCAFFLLVLHSAYFSLLPLADCCF